jgi:hypothetical protein
MTRGTLGLGQKPPNKKLPNNEKYKLMGFFCVVCIFLFLFLCLTVRICKIFFVFYNMIQDFFLPLYFTSNHICIFLDLLYCYLWINIIFVYYFS